MEALHALVNEARGSPRTCGALGPFEAAQPMALEVRLMTAAQRHSDDMHVNGFMGHTGSDGSTLQQRVEREGYAWRALGENVAWGYATPESVMSAWLASDGHCANVMNPAFVELGLGLEGRSWTQVFARPW
ncbi:MAG: CAP domain-containing protein [Trueperaceae bacterium]|nr:MAG: CAP domain-containing protein [Trueperaceae bacterium]